MEFSSCGNVSVQIKLDFGALWISHVTIREFQVQFNILVCGMGVEWEDMTEKVWGRIAGIGVAGVNRLSRMSFIGMLKFEKNFWKSKNYPARLPVSVFRGGRWRGS